MLAFHVAEVPKLVILYFSCIIYIVKSSSELDLIFFSFLYIYLWLLKVRWYFQIKQNIKKRNQAHNSFLTTHSSTPETDMRGPITVAQFFRAHPHTRCPFLFLTHALRPTETESGVQGQRNRLPARPRRFRDFDRRVLAAREGSNEGGQHLRDPYNIAHIPVWLPA